MEEANPSQKNVAELRAEKQKLSVERRRLILRSLLWAGILPGLLGILFACLSYSYLPARTSSWGGGFLVPMLNLIGFSYTYPLLLRANKLADQIRQINWKIEEIEGLRRVEKITARIASGALKPNPGLR
jgi:hypothetical protein